MSDLLLLSLLWVVPLAGSIAVLLMPKGATSAIRWTSLGVTRAPFRLTLVAFSTYIGQDSRAQAPLAERAKNNRLVGDGSANSVLRAEESGAAQSDLMVRRDWISYFKIQYFLGIDGISLSLILLTGLVS